MDKKIEFTNTWFNDAAKNQWDKLLPQIKPKKILEIGSFEGASTCYLIQNLSKDNPIEIHCIDPWKLETDKVGDLWDSNCLDIPEDVNMSNVEKRFRNNTDIAIEKSVNKVDLKIYKGFSADELSKMLAVGMRDYFDFIYIDGGHQGPDVLTDAVLSFRLLKVGGVIVFDDYLWQVGKKDLISIPKLAIDSFVNIYSAKINIFNAPLYQLYIKKVSH
jgi:hypothetical protein